MTTNESFTARVPVHLPVRNPVLGLRSPKFLARWPIVGLCLFVFGSLVFGGLAYNLKAQGPLLGTDRAIAVALPAIGLNSPPYVKSIMDAGFYVGSQVIVGLGILLGVYFLIKHYWRELAMVAIGLVGSSLLFYSLSTFFARVRPPTQMWIIEKIPGFPSGHPITVVVFYGLLAYLLAPKMRSAFGKGMVVAVALIIIGFVGFTRVFTGGHYLTDVLAGYAVGIAWAGAAYTLIEIYFQKRRSQNVK